MTLPFSTHHPYNKMSTTIKIHHTGAEWLAMDRWVKAEQEEKGVRGPKSIAAEAEARAVYKAARAENKAARASIKMPPPIEIIHVHPNAQVEVTPIKIKATVEPKAPVEPKTPIKIKTSLTPPPINATVTRHQVSGTEARLATLGAVAGLRATKNTKNTWLYEKRAQILAKMAPKKKVDLSGLEDWVDPSDPYDDRDYESA